MADQRTYVRVHDGMDEHPKIEGLSDAAFRALHRCWYLASRQLTDGALTDASWRNRAKTAKVRGELIDARLVHEPGYRCPHPADQCPPVKPGHVQMHDYLDHQRSAVEVEELKRKRAEAGKRGGKAKANALASAKQTLKQTGSKSVPSTDTDTEELLRSSQTRGRATPTPARFEITEILRSWASSRAPGIDLDRETERFLDHHRAKGSTFKDWPAAWRTWMSRAGQYQANGHRRAVDDVPNVYRDVKPWEL